MKALMTMNLLLFLTASFGFPLLAKAETTLTLLSNAVSKLPGVSGSTEGQGSKRSIGSTSAKSQLKNSDPNLLLHQEEDEGQIAHTSNKAVFSGHFSDSTAARVDGTLENGSVGSKKTSQSGNH